MMKSICALTHKPDSDRATFQTYYEKSHVPLGASLFPFTRYVRNHVVSEGFGWDTITEFWFRDQESIALLMLGPVGDRMRVDERLFMDQSKIAPASAREVVLSPGDPADAEGLRTMVLVAPGVAEEAVLEWAASLAKAQAGVSVDFAASWREPEFPASAVVWLPGHGEVSPPSALSAQVLRVRRAETPPETLLGNRAQAGV